MERLLKVSGWAVLGARKKHYKIISYYVGDCQENREEKTKKQDFEACTGNFSEKRRIFRKKRGTAINYE